MVTDNQIKSESESNHVLLKKADLMKPRPKSGPGGYGSHLTKEELDYWVKKVPISY